MTDQSMWFSEDAWGQVALDVRQLAQKPLRGRGATLTVITGRERKGAGVPWKALAVQFGESAHLEKVVREQLGRIG